jgi:hypothetical protein
MKHFFFIKNSPSGGIFHRNATTKAEEENTFFIHFFLKFCPAPNLCSSFAHLKKQKIYRANIFETKKKTLTPSKGKLTFFLLKQTVPTWLI